MEKNLLILIFTVCFITGCMGRNVKEREFYSNLNEIPDTAIILLNVKGKVKKVYIELLSDLLKKFIQGKKIYVKKVELVSEFKKRDLIEIFRENRDVKGIFVVNVKISKINVIFYRNCKVDGEICLYTQNLKHICWEDTENKRKISLPTSLESILGNIVSEIINSNDPLKSTILQWSFSITSNIPEIKGYYFITVGNKTYNFEKFFNKLKFYRNKKFGVGEFFAEDKKENILPLKDLTVKWNGKIISLLRKNNFKVIAKHDFKIVLKEKRFMNFNEYKIKYQIEILIFGEVISSDRGYDLYIKAIDLNNGEIISIIQIENINLSEGDKFDMLYLQHKYELPEPKRVDVEKFN